MINIKKIIILLVLFSVTLFANNIATITAIKGKASIERDSQSIVANLGSKLQKKDSVITQDKTKVQIIFNDETIITIGKNSNFSISEYLFDNTNEMEVKFSLLKGAMRTITGQIGKIAPQKFSVKTNTSTIGIRGTNFTIFAGIDNSQKIYCTYGAISVDINGKNFMVNQGFLLDISSNSESEIQEFSAKDLKSLNDANFGKSATKDSTVSSEKKVTKATSIDTTIQDVSNIVMQDIQDTQAQALTIDKTEKLTTNDKIDIYQIKDPFINYSPINASMNSWGYMTDMSTENSYATNFLYLFRGEYNGVSHVSGWISLWSENDEQVELYTTSIPASYNENFATTFSEVYKTDYETGAQTNGTLGSTNSFRATADDLSPTDKMHWGDWSVSYTLDGISKNKNGLWTAGDSMMDDDNYDTIEAYTINNVVYDGIYRANYDSSVVDGTAAMVVNFGEGTASLSISQPNSEAQWASYSMNESYGEIHGYQDNGSGYTHGVFYGETGNSAGGDFSLEESGSIVAKGVYQVQTQTILH